MLSQITAGHISHLRETKEEEKKEEERKEEEEDCMGA